MISQAWRPEQKLRPFSFHGKLKHQSCKPPVPLCVATLQAGWHPSTVSVSTRLCEGVCANTCDARSRSLGEVDFSAG